MLRNSQSIVIGARQVGPNTPLFVIAEIGLNHGGSLDRALALVDAGAAAGEYWCPIKHSARIPAPHQRYHLFVDYGDAEGYHDGLPRIRRDYGDVDVDDDRGFR